MSPGIKLPHFHLLDYCSYSASMLHWWWCENWTEKSRRPTSRLSLLIIFPQEEWRRNQYEWHGWSLSAITLSPHQLSADPDQLWVALQLGKVVEMDKNFCNFFLNCPSSFDGNCPGPCLVKLINCCVFAHRPAHFWNNGLKHDLARSRFQLRP